MTIIDKNYDALLMLVARRGRSLIIAQLANMLLHLGDVFLRIAAINWCFIQLTNIPIIIPIKPLCAFAAGEIILQIAIAASDVLVSTIGKKFDDQCMNDALCTVFDSSPQLRIRDHLSDKLSDYKFNVSYIGSVSRNVGYAFDFAAFGCSILIYIAGIIWLLYSIILANIPAGIITSIIALAMLTWAALIRRSLTETDESIAFSNILRTERQRRYYLFNIVHHYSVHSVIDTFHARNFIKSRYRSLNNRGLKENTTYMRSASSDQRRFLLRQIILFIVMMGTIAVFSVMNTGALYMYPMFVGISVQAMTSGLQAMNAYRQIRRVSPHLGNIVDVLTTTEQQLKSSPSAKDSHYETHSKQNMIIQSIKSIDFEDVWFAYDGAKEYALRGITMHLPVDNNIIAIVGSNGAGKSTMLGLMSGVLQPTKGHVRINGIDTCDLNSDRYIDAVGMLPQESHLFSGTIRENILSGSPTTEKTTPEQLLMRMDTSEGLLTCLDHHVESLESDNMSISGGETQRIAIARLLAVPGRHLYLLDEPTSSFDPEARTAFFHRLRELVHGVTTVVVTHDIESCSQTDYILVIENGKLLEQGTFEELIKRNRRFAYLLSCQLNNRR